MTAATTKKATPVQRRRSIATEILGHLSGIARSTLKVGELLADAKSTFKPDQNADFLVWAEATVGLKKSAVFQYMQAAEVVASVPEVLNATDSIRTLSYLARFTPDETREVLKEAGKDTTAAGIESAAAKVIDRVKVQKEKATATAEQKDKETRDSSTQASQAVARKLAAKVKRALRTLDAEVGENPENAIRMALVLGAQFGTTSPLAPKVVGDLCKEYDAEVVAESTDQ